MSGSIYEYGNLKIPEDKKAAFLEDAEKIVKYGGLFSKSTVLLFGKELHLISIPKFEGTRAELSHSYFEENGWLQSGFIIDKCKPFGCFVGKAQFNKAMYALFILAELYYPDTAGGPADDSDVVLAVAYRHAGIGTYDYISCTVRKPYGNEAVALIEIDGVEPCLADILEIADPAPLGDAEFRYHIEIAVQDGLADVQDIDAPFKEHMAHLGDDALAVVAQHRHHGFRYLLHRFSPPLPRRMAHF